MTEPSDIGRLLIQCEDRPGIVAAVSTFLAQHGAKIVELHQYCSAPENGRFFQRTVFHLDGLAAALPWLETAFAPIADRFGFHWSLTNPNAPRSWCPSTTTAYWTYSGAPAAANSTSTR